ncbi:MAG TPA: VOC family protein [Caulobacteraceae bacterium]|jgi:catechol 2,3-dioxygenase-like lactoylglutathione lyase family enzyme
MTLEAIDHVQVAIPGGGEGAARAFYAGLLGLAEQPKPANLAARGGAWFESAAVKVHCGVEEPFHPARKAHIAFRVDDVAVIARRAREAGYEVADDEPLPGHERIYIYDPFGNRLEFLRPLAASDPINKNMYRHNAFD